MPVRDPIAGRAFVCVISWFLFITITGGGVCLIMYMILPETNTTSWLPVVGITLVCLPWLFWLSTFLYRVLSRVFGFRIGFGSSNNSQRTNNVMLEEEEAAAAAAALASSDHSDQTTESPGGGHNGRDRRVQFEATLTVHENDIENDDVVDHDTSKDSIVSKSSSSSSNSSALSRESELPLASSMES